MQASNAFSFDTEELKRRVNLLDLVSRDTRLKRVSSTRGGEYAGPCPFCGGTDRFHVQPERGLWWCRRCSPGDRWSDAIAYAMQRDNLSFREACLSLGAKPTTTTTRPVVSRVVSTKVVDDNPPPAKWQETARALVIRAEERLWSSKGERARDYLGNVAG